MDEGLIRISSATEIAKVLMCFNNYFPRSIESRVGDLDAYAQKLLKNAFVYVVQVNDEIAGMVVFYANDLLSKVAYLSQIAVLTEHQSKGIGSLLLRFSCDLSQKYGMKKMRLEVDKTNFKAISYYEKHKFITVNKASLDSQYMIKELI